VPPRCAKWNGPEAVGERSITVYMSDGKNSQGLQIPCVFADSPAQETKGDTVKSMVLAVFNC
jgi:hypothetical protein